MLQNSPQSDTYVLPDDTYVLPNDVVVPTESLNGDSSYVMPATYKLPSDAVHQEQMRVKNELTQVREIQD